MTVVLSPEQIDLPTTRRPNKIKPVPVAAKPVDSPYVVGKPWLDPFTPPDHYAGPVPFPGMATPAWARKTVESSQVPILRPDAARAAAEANKLAPVYRDFYASGPCGFWPCTRRRMRDIGVNRTLPVEPVFTGLGEDSSTAPKALAIGAVAAVGTFFLAKAVLRRR